MRKKAVADARMAREREKRLERQSAMLSWLKKDVPYVNVVLKMMYADLALIAKIGTDVRV